MQVKVVMQSPVSAVDVDAPVDEARSLMSTYGLRQLPVTQGATLVGLVTERALRRLEPSTVPPLDTWEWVRGLDRLRVRDAALAPALSVAPDASVTEAASMLAANRLEALPVVEGDELVGLVSVRDLLGVLGRDGARPRRSGLEHVLAVVDDDPESATLTTAVALARRHDARLTLVRVLAPLPRQQTVELSSAQWGLLSARRRDAARAWLASQVSDTAEGRAADLVVTEGPVTAEVVALASGREVDLVVVDAGLAAPMIAQSPCPVLGVPRARRDRHARR